MSIPRLSHYAGVGDKANFNKLFNNIFNALIVVVAPAVVGLFALSREVVLFISGESYLDAVMPLQILSLALIVCLFGWLYNSCALLPCGREKELFWITLVSGLLNVGLNILLIPRFRENAAAFTTLLAELCSMILCIRCSRGLVAVSADRRTVGSVLCGCAGIVLVCTGVKALALPNLVSILAAVLGSVAAYAVILLGMKNPLGAGISGKSEAEVPENILNGQDPLRGRTLPAAGPFWKKRRFLVCSGKITTFLCFCNKCLLINYPSPVLAIHTLFVYNKGVRGSSQCAAPDEEQNSIPNEKNLRGVCYHGLGKKTIDDQNYCGKKVLVRCDFNVPMKDGVITNENRINAALPTIQKLVNDGAKVILCSHLASPRTAPRQSSAWHPLLWL